MILVLAEAGKSLKNVVEENDVRTEQEEEHGRTCLLRASWTNGLECRK